MDVNVEATKSGTRSRYTGDRQVFDSDIIESVERQCDIAVNEIRDRRKQKRNAEAKLQDVGLCVNMLGEANEYIDDIEYQVGFIRNNLNAYRKDMVNEEESGIDFFNSLNVDVFNTLINTPVVYGNLEVQVDNVPVIESAAISVGNTSSVVEEPAVAQEAEKVDLVSIIPESDVPSAVTEQPVIAEGQEQTELHNILPDMLRNVSPSTQPKKESIGQVVEGFGSIGSHEEPQQEVVSNTNTDGRSINEVAANFTSGIGNGF